MKILLFLIGLVIACPGFSQWETSFDTRVSSNLAIGGNKCNGGEESGASDRLCEKDQWLIYLDDSQSEMKPFIAKLTRVNIISPRNTEFYEIVPKDKLYSSKRRLLSRYWVKFDLNHPPVVEWRMSK